MEQFQITLLTQKHIPQVADLFSEILENCPYYSDAARIWEKSRYTQDWLEKKLSNPDTIAYVALDGDELIWFCCGNFDYGTAWFDWIGIRNKSRHHWIAFALTQACEQDAKLRWAHKVWLDSRVNNTESVSLLEKMQYQKICTLHKHWYWLDFYLWEKYL